MENMEKDLPIRIANHTSDQLLTVMSIWLWFTQQTALYTIRYAQLCLLL